MMSTFFPLFTDTKSIWKINQRDKLLEESYKKRNFSQIPNFQDFQQRCTWAVIKLTAKLFKIELSLYAALFKWRNSSEEPLAKLLHNLSKEHVEYIYILLTNSQPWNTLSSPDLLFALRWIETVLVILRFNPIRVRFPDEKFCPALYTLDALRICAKDNHVKQDLPQLFERLRHGCKQVFQEEDLLYIDPLEYLISVNQEKYKEMIKWVSIADGMRSSFMQLLHFQTMQEEMLDKLYAWIYKICLFMQLQNIWTIQEMSVCLDMLWAMKQNRVSHFKN